MLLYTAPECEAITDLRKERNKETGKGTRRRGNDAAGTQPNLGKRKEVEVFVQDTGGKAEPVQNDGGKSVGKKGKRGKSGIGKMSLANQDDLDSDGSSVQVICDVQAKRSKQKRGHAKKKCTDDEMVEGESHKRPDGHYTAKKVPDKSCGVKNDEKMHDRENIEVKDVGVGKRRKKEVTGVKFPMKRCDVSVERVSLTNISPAGQQIKQRPARKGISSNRLAGPCASVSNIDDIDSSIEILDDSKDLSWEFVDVDGGTWNENKQSKTPGNVEATKSPKMLQSTVMSLNSTEKYSNDVSTQKAADSKRKGAPLASDTLEVECIVDLKYRVEDELEGETDPVFKDGVKGQHVKMFHSTMEKGYDAINADPTYVCIFCQQQPHRFGLGDLFGPYWVEKGGR